MAAVVPAMTPEERELVSRVESRRIALSGDMALYRSRCEEVMRWANPPWDAVSRRVEPRVELATARRQGEAPIHIDLVGPTLTRWAVLTTGAAPIFRVKPKFIPPPLPSNDPNEAEMNRKKYEFQSAIAQDQSMLMEARTQDWMEFDNLHRTLLWASWGKEAFGKAILKSGWNEEENRPTVELMENPTQVYYGWTKRYGSRRLQWVIVVDQMSAAEANDRFGLDIPTDDFGAVDWTSWTGLLDDGEMDQQPEQQTTNQSYVYVQEYWELVRENGKTFARNAFIVANRVVEVGDYPWKRLPFHVIENEHLSTWMHGRSTAEAMIPINAAYDETLDRQNDVIRFESGPRYKGMNMANSGDEVEIPSPFEMTPLREGEDILQIDTRVDFFPAQLHMQELRDAKYKATGLTPIAWGMSPNAQTSGRAMSAEWRAVELPLASRLINMGPDVKELLMSWWDYAEQYDSDSAGMAKGYRRFEVIWVPLDIRDKTEKTLDIIQRLQANILDPETAIEETGKENGPEILAKVRAYLMDPIWNPLRYQQYLTLKQLELNIAMQAQQLQAMQQPAPAQGPPPPNANAGPEQQGATASGQAAQGPGGPVTEAQNQPGQTPGSALPMQTSVLSQTPLTGGIGNRIIVPLQGPPASNGQQPR
jgi:hypothetical protein